MLLLATFGGALLIVTLHSVPSLLKHLYVQPFFLPDLFDTFGELVFPFEPIAREHICLLVSILLLVVSYLHAFELFEVGRKLHQHFIGGVNFELDLFPELLVVLVRSN